MDMVEKVAKAVCLAQWGGYPFGRGEREAWPQWAQALKVARAAIEAMHEPSDDMIDAGVAARMRLYDKLESEGVDTRTLLVSKHPAGTIYAAMIDVALKEQEKVG